MKKSLCKSEKCCDMRGMLSFLILFLLSRRNMHGQELADELELRKGDRPSPGTIYPALKALKEEGFVREHADGKLNVYSLTAAGKKALGVSKKMFARAFVDVI